MKKGKSISYWMSKTLVKPTRDHAHDHTPSTNPPKASTGKRRKAVRGGHKNEPVRNEGSTSDAPWITRYQPKTAADLAIHKKKIAEVQQWLEFALSSGSRRPMLLLTGPPGCGKTATLQALAGDMNCSILEWVNPITDVGGPSMEDFHPGDQILFPESQTKQFQNFIIRANHYPSLVIGGEGVAEGSVTKKIVLVEEFPNAFLKDPSKFYQVLRSVQSSLHYPLVFIVSESHHGGASASNIFRKELISNIDIHTISFNPVSHTSLVKTLHKIASTECQPSIGMGHDSASDWTPEQPKVFMPPKEVLEQLADSCYGDVRSAINSLQFICLKDCSDLLTVEESKGNAKKLEKSGGSRQGSKSSGSSTTKLRRHPSGCEMLAQLSGIGSRDASLFLFRALGKILYCKRDTDQGVTESLPAHLKEHERAPLLVAPESVVENTQISPNMFVLYLHENYSDFFNELEDVTDALMYLSDSDVLSQMWSESQEIRLTLQEYGSSVACRGLIHCNRSRAAGKWRPLHKPQWNSISKQYQENSSSARRVFLHLGSSPYAHLWTPIELQTEILPYMAVINTRLRNPDQVSLLQSLTHFKSTRYHRSQTQCLGERDVETTGSSLSAQPSVESAPSVAASYEGGKDCVHPTAMGASTADITASQGSSSSSHLTLSQNTRMTTEQELHNSDDEIGDFDDDDIW